MTDKESALCHFAMMARLVILSVSEKSIKFNNPLSVFVWILRCAQYDKGENKSVRQVSIAQRVLSMINSRFCLNF